MHQSDEIERDDTLPVRAPRAGLAAALSFFVPGLGQLYSGRILAAALWFLGTAFAYWAVLIPGFIAHAICIWSAYQSAKYWRGF